MELLEKLKIKADQPLWLINTPPNCIDLFAGSNFKEKLGKEKPLGQLILFAIDTQELNHFLPLLADYISHDTLFWICYPKKTGSISSDLIFMESWHLVFQSGYRGQTSVSINDDWSGFRITSAPKKNPTVADLPNTERNIEGIDFVNRTVNLPEDALALVNKHRGMAAFFDSLSFTTKKEYVIAIIEAKKEGTRQKRIENMIAIMQQKMNDRL